jgi:hypothetical protein
MAAPDLIIPSCDGDARQFKRKIGAAFEASGSLCVFYNAIGARTLGDRQFAFYLHGRFDGGGKLVARMGGLRANGLVKHDGNDGVCRNHEGFRFKRPLYRILGGLGGGWRGTGGRVRTALGLLVRRFLALAAGDEQAQKQRTHKHRTTTTNHQKTLQFLGWITSFQHTPKWVEVQITTERE